ncbi:MAG: PASTA domain-containing protein [Ruminococcus sp.]|nr:PASTA domain-containing protein [Ruminococcus sp.]
MYCYNCMNKLPDNNTFCQRCGRESVPDRSTHHLPPGTVLDSRYMIGNALGEDGYSITYIGRDLNLDIRVSVKEYYPMGHVSRDNTVSNSLMITANEEERAYFREGSDRFVEEARQLQASGADIRDMFSENHTVYVITAMQKQQTTRPTPAPRRDAGYGDNFDGSETAAEKNSVDISSNAGKQQPPQKKKKGPVIAIAIIASVVVLALVGMIFFFLLNGKKGNANPSATTAAATTAAATTAAQSSAKDDSIKMPDTRGMKFADAQGQLQGIGLKVEVTRENSNEVSKDYVIRQSVDAGQSLRKGDTVMIYVSDGAAEQPTTQEQHAAPEFDSYSASSTRTDESVSYDVQNIAVNNSDCWSAAGGDNGEWVRLGANSDQWVKGITLINGNAKDSASFERNSRATALRFEFADGTSIEKSVEDTPNQQNIDFGKEVKTSSVKVTVIGHHDGSENKNICLTYVRPY